MDPVTDPGSPQYWQQHIPQEMAQENRDDCRDKVKVICRPEGSPHLTEIDFAEGQD